MKDVMVEHSRIQYLVGRARDGDRSAFDELMHDHRRRLLAFITPRIGEKLRPHLDPEDVLQETFMRAFETIDRFEWRGEDSFFSWLAAVAGHLILNAAKKSRPDRIEVDRTTPDGTTSPSSVLRRNERFDRLEDSLRLLTPDQRKALVLARIDGLRAQEIARRMDRSEEAVRQLLTRALRQLRSSFGDTESLHLPDRRLLEEGSGHA
jgi:RNA polymerase sigma-70 factor (ECF subfamily)